MYKVSIKETGEIDGIQTIYSEEDAFWIDGIPVDGVFAAWVEADLLEAINTKYFSFEAGGFIDRPIMPAVISKNSLNSDGVDSIKIKKLPNPCQIVIDAIVYSVNDGEFEFVTKVSGTYTVVCKAFPYTDKTWRVVAI